MPRIFVAAYLAALNLLAFIAGWQDKMSAIRRRRRIPERTLWTLALMGGAPGLYVAMLIFRHKTLHRRFAVGVPLAAVAILLLVLWLWPRLPR